MQTVIRISINRANAGTAIVKAGLRSKNMDWHGGFFVEAVLSGR
jgi:hypothetical protein